MKRYAFILLLLPLWCGMTAQPSIFDSLSKFMPGMGKITIYQAPDIAHLITDHNRDATTEVFRIQVFSGNDQRKSKEEAAAKQKEINEHYNIATYITFTAPFWRLRVGDFSSYEEAFEMMGELTRTFPPLKKESNIIKEEMKLLPENKE